MTPPTPHIPRENNTKKQMPEDMALYNTLLISLYSCSQLNIVEGKMQYLYDEHGKRYLDCFGGIVTVSCGHCHPDIVNAVLEQTKLLQHTTTIYLHHAIVEFAEALASKMPGNLKVTY
jgi:alanine-glyoxylate transaminase/(R)-3-amino-2-methylpropionate-pyruvate transaminase